MAKIDNERMWASMLNYKPTTEDRKRVSRALMSDRNFPFGVVKNILIRGALREQGLMEKYGEIVDYEPQFKAGDWVVHGKSTCCVSEVLDKQLVDEDHVKENIEKMAGIRKLIRRTEI